MLTQAEIVVSIIGPLTMSKTVLVTTHRLCKWIVNLVHFIVE